MKILGIDTSGPACSAALWSDGKLIAEKLMNSALTHSETLMPAVAELLEGEGLRPSDMDLFAVIAGPGSFTGVRLGVCAVKALCMASGKPCARINSLRALAEGTAFEGLICPILDARRSQVYCALFRRKDGLLTCVMEDKAIPISELLASLPKDETVCFTGDGVKVFTDTINASDVQAYILPGHLSVLTAGAACFIAETDESTHMDARMLTPIYLRLSQAERERNERATRAKI